jgi:hypothetical protein
MAIPIVIRKTYVLWAPRNDDRAFWLEPMTVFIGISRCRVSRSSRKVSSQSGDLTSSEIRRRKWTGSVRHQHSGGFEIETCGQPHLQHAVVLPGVPGAIPFGDHQYPLEHQPMQQLLSKIDSKPTAPLRSDVPDWSGAGEGARRAVLQLHVQEFRFTWTRRRGG